MVEEIWKDIPGFESIYMVSNLGNIKRLPTIIGAKHGLTRPFPGKLLKQIDNEGYKRIMLSINNKQKIYQVHRLVAAAFIPNPHEKPFINHINANKSDNRIENLEWCTQSENIKHAFNIGTKPKPTGGERRYGVDHPLSKSVTQLSLEGVFIKTWYGITSIHREMGFVTSNIIKCCKGQIKTAYGFKWQYA